MSANTKRNAATSQKRARGRPTVWTVARRREMAALICTAMEDGDTPTRYLRRLAASVSPEQAVPTPGTFYGWMHHGQPGAADLAKRYIRARRARAAVWTDEVIAIANDGSNDSYIDSKGNRRVDFDVINRSKLRVDTIFRLLAMEQSAQAVDNAAAAERDTAAQSPIVYLPALLPVGAPIDND